MYRFPSVVLLALCVACAPAEDGDGPQTAASAPSPTYRGDRIGHYGFGTDATTQQIAGWDIDVRPDGSGLPAGSGSVSDGETLYDEKCAECHGTFGEGVGRYPVLAGGEGTLMDARPTKTVGSYWPYTSTLFDYIRRTMPFTQPESLSAEETYALTAYVLYLNDLVDDDLVLDQSNLATIRLPNEANFVPDPRPDVANERCMTDCRDAAAISILSGAVGNGTSDPDDTDVEDAVAVTSGQQTYDQYCHICHEAGVGGAPVLGESNHWSVRMDAGIDTLIDNAINGMASDQGVMPPKGGFVHLPDDDVKQAVEYMVDQSI
jgi:cytochrome c